MNGLYYDAISPAAKELEEQFQQNLSESVLDETRMNV